MNLLLVNNHSVQNAGDDAILRETLRVLAEAFPDAQVSLSFNDVPSARAALPDHAIYSAPFTWFMRPDAAGEYHLMPRAQRLVLLLILVIAACVLRVWPRAPRLGIAREHHALLRAYAEADMVLACGGGYIYAPGPNEGIAGVFNITLLGCMFAVIMGKPLVLLPQSIGPLHDAPQRRVVRWIVRHARLTLVRERPSLALLQELGCAERVLLAPDMAFGFAGATPQRGQAVLGAALATEASVRVGITALNWSGQSYTFNGQSGYERALLACIDTITAEGGQVILFPQCTGPSAGEDDRRTSARLHAGARQPEHVVVLDEPLAPDVLQAAYGQMDVFIGTRMHSVILALNAGVPALAVGYLHKTRGVLAELGLCDVCLDISTVTGDALVAAFEQLRAAPGQPTVAPYLARAHRFKQSLPALLHAALGDQPSEQR